MLPVMAVVSPVSFLAGALVGSFLLPPDSHRIYRWEFVEPVAVFRTLQQRVDPAHRVVWESLDRDTREAVEAFDSTQSSETPDARAVRRLRRSLNDLIGAEQPIFDEALVTDQFSQPPLRSDDMRRQNRRLLEAAFPGSIQRYVKEPGSWALMGRVFSLSAWSTRWSVVGVLVAIWGLLTPLMAYAVSLKTLRIYFKQIGAADAFLDYYLRDFGFKAPQKEGDEFVFRATLWTWSLYGVLRLRARIIGNTVVLTGPAPIMRRLTKRILLFAEGAQ